jgi:hypothetical protein
MMLLLLLPKTTADDPYIAAVSSLSWCGGGRPFGPVLWKID